MADAVSAIRVASPFKTIKLRIVYRRRSKPDGSTFFLHYGNILVVFRDKSSPPPLPPTFNIRA